MCDSARRYWSQEHPGFRRRIPLTDGHQSYSIKIKRIFLRSFFSAGNLLLCKRKNPPDGGLVRPVRSLRPLLTGVVAGYTRPQIPKLFFQCSLNQAITSRPLSISLSYNSSCQWLLPEALCRVFPDWTQDDSYRIRRSSRTERGVRAYSPAWSELPTRN